MIASGRDTDGPEETTAVDTRGSMATMGALLLPARFPVGCSLPLPGYLIALQHDQIQENANKRLNGGDFDATLNVGLGLPG